MAFIWPSPQQSQASQITIISRGKTSTISGNLKIAGVVVIAVLLSICLFALGPGLVIKGKLLNPDFIISEVNRLDLSSLANDFITEQVSSDLPFGITEAISRTVNQLEPKLKQGVNASIDQVYGYLHGERTSPDLHGVLRNTVLNGEFIRLLVDETDIVAMIKPVLHELVRGWIPQELEALSRNIYPIIDETLVSQESYLKAQLKNAAEPLVDYLLGEKEGFSLTISTAPFIAEMEQRMQQEIGELTVPQLSMLPDLFEPFFHQFFDQVAAQIPTSIQIDESIIGPDIPAAIRTSLSTAEVNLKIIRQYIGNFQFFFIILIFVILVLITGICLIYRALKGAARALGIVFLISGTGELIILMLLGNYITDQLGLLAGNLPWQLQQWLQQFSSNILSPMQLLGIGFILGGIVLLLVSFFYSPRPSVENV